MRLSRRVIEISTIVTVLTVFAAADQASLPEQETEPAERASHYSFEKALTRSGPANINFQYSRTRSGHDRIVTVLCDGGRNAPGDSRSDLSLKLSNRRFSGLLECGRGRYVSSVSVRRMTSLSHPGPGIRNVGTPAKVLSVIFRESVLNWRTGS
jgi:hypothetical protein